MNKNCGKCIDYLRVLLAYQGLYSVEMMCYRPNRKTKGLDSRCLLSMFIFGPLFRLFPTQSSILFDLLNHIVDYI
jgi:hypothetical protein